MSKEITLVLATEKDAEIIHEMKYEAFLPLYNKYHDDKTNPVMEKIEKVIGQIQSEGSDYYLIRLKDENAGAVRIVRRKDEKGFIEGAYRISPLFILPKFQNQGIGYVAIQKVFEQYPHAKNWSLDTIKQEVGNCHLYEKCGFVRKGGEKSINEAMTLIDYEKSIQ